MIQRTLSLSRAARRRLRCSIIVPNLIVCTVAFATRQMISTGWGKTMVAAVEWPRATRAHFALVGERTLANHPTKIVLGRQRAWTIDRAPGPCVVALASWACVTAMEVYVSSQRETPARPQHHNTRNRGFLSPTIDQTPMNPLSPPCLLSSLLCLAWATLLAGRGATPLFLDSVPAGDGDAHVLAATIAPVPCPPPQR